MCCNVGRASLHEGTSGRPALPQNCCPKHEPSDSCQWPTPAFYQIESPTWEEVLHSLRKEMHHVMMQAYHIS